MNDGSGTLHYLIGGHWDEAFTLAKIVSGEGKNVVTEPPQVLWRADPPRWVLTFFNCAYSEMLSCSRTGRELMYGFSEFTCSLNEPEPGVAPTDCRLRPDIRVMEEQDFDLANKEKVIT